jgi:hypothetical protein
MKGLAHVQNQAERVHRPVLELSADRGPAAAVIRRRHFFLCQRPVFVSQHGVFLLFSGLVLRFIAHMRVAETAAPAAGRAVAGMMQERVQDAGGGDIRSHLIRVGLLRDFDPAPAEMHPAVSEMVHPVEMERTQRRNRPRLRRPCRRHEQGQHDEK